MWTVRITWREFAELLQGRKVEKVIDGSGRLYITAARGLPPDITVESGGTTIKVEGEANFNDPVLVLSWIPPLSEDMPQGILR